MDDPTIPLPRFTPVPQHRRRAHGWSPDHQFAFVQALARCGVVSAAARSVGRTPRSAYQLRNRKGAESFALAWDCAVLVGDAAMADDALERCERPRRVPIVRRGQVIGWRETQDHRLFFAAMRRYQCETVNRCAPHIAATADRVINALQVAEGDYRHGPAVWPEDPPEPAEAPPPPPEPETDLDEDRQPRDWQDILAFKTALRHEFDMDVHPPRWRGPAAAPAIRSI